MPLSSDQRQVVEEFIWTMPRHSGHTEWAAPILGVSTAALEQTLHRARRDGMNVSYTTTKEKAN